MVWWTLKVRLAKSKFKYVTFLNKSATEVKKLENTSLTTIQISIIVYGIKINSI